MLDFYVDVLRRLGREPGLLGDIFSGAQSRFSNPVNLKRLVGLIDETAWTALDVDVKAAAFEGLQAEFAVSHGVAAGGVTFYFAALAFSKLYPLGHEWHRYSPRGSVNPRY